MSLLIQSEYAVCAHYPFEFTLLQHFHHQQILWVSDSRWGHFSWMLLLLLDSYIRRQQSNLTLLLCHLGPTHVWNRYIHDCVIRDDYLHTREVASSTKKAMLFFLLEKKSLFPFFRSEKRWQTGFFKSPNCANEMDCYLHFAHCAGFFCTIADSLIVADRGSSINVVTD